MRSDAPGASNNGTHASSSSSGEPPWLAAPDLPIRSHPQWCQQADFDLVLPDEAVTLDLKRHQVNPKKRLFDRSLVVRPEPGLITRSTSIAAIGSCFASRLLHWLHDHAYNVVRAEPGADRPVDQSARWGRVFNTHCMLQTALRAVDAFHPAEDRWLVSEGVVRDPYRDSMSFPDEAALEQDLRRHAAAIRTVFERAQVVIATPGIAEVWRSARDGSVFAAAPPKSIFDPARHRFERSSVEENVANLERFFEILRSLNPSVRLVLTLSPVPLLATFRDMHCVVASAASKATLRVAIDRFCEAHPEVVYFPSYEIVQTLGRDAFLDDNVHVRDEVVARIMTEFMTCYGDLGFDDARRDALARARAPLRTCAHDAATPRSEAGGVTAYRTMQIAYLREVWRRLAVQHAGRPIALYAAARHTERLLASVADLRAPRVAFILDDAPSRGQIRGAPVRRPAEASPSDVAAVVASTDAHQEAVLRRAHAWAAGADPAPVVEPLYEGLPPGPYAPANPLSPPR